LDLPGATFAYFAVSLLCANGRYMPSVIWSADENFLLVPGASEESRNTRLWIHVVRQIFRRRNVVALDGGIDQCVEAGVAESELISPCIWRRVVGLDLRSCVIWACYTCPISAIGRLL
jgi:hypothetical protein